jgi:hypothetical protein
MMFSLIFLIKTKGFEKVMSLSIFPWGDKRNGIDQGEQQDVCAINT